METNVSYEPFNFAKPFSSKGPQRLYSVFVKIVSGLEKGTKSSIVVSAGTPSAHNLSW